MVSKPKIKEQYKNTAWIGRHILRSKFLMENQIEIFQEMIGKLDTI